MRERSIKTGVVSGDGKMLPCLNERNRDFVNSNLALQKQKGRI